MNNKTKRQWHAWWITWALSIPLGITIGSVLGLWWMAGLTVVLVCTFTWLYIFEENPPWLSWRK